MAVSGPSAPPGHDHTGHSQRRKSLLVGEAGGDSPPVNPSLALSQCCMPRNIFGLIHMTFCKRVHLTQLFRSASRCFIHVFLSVFYISPDIESCTLKEYLIIYPHLTCIHTHPSVIQVFLSPSLSSPFYIWEVNTLYCLMMARWGQPSSLISHCGHWRL